MVVNILATKFGGWAATKLAAHFPGLASAGANLATKLGLDETAAMEAKTGTLAVAQRVGKKAARTLINRIAPSKGSVATGVAGALQQPVTYALTDK